MYRALSRERSRRRPAEPNQQASRNPRGRTSRGRCAVRSALGYRRPRSVLARTQARRQSPETLPWHLSNGRFDACRGLRARGRCLLPVPWGRRSLLTRGMQRTKRLLMRARSAASRRRQSSSGAARPSDAAAQRPSLGWGGQTLRALGSRSRRGGEQRAPAGQRAECGSAVGDATARASTRGSPSGPDWWGRARAARCHEAITGKTPRRCVPLTIRPHSRRSRNTECCRTARS